MSVPDIAYDTQEYRLCPYRAPLGKCYTSTGHGIGPRRTIARTWCSNASRSSRTCTRYLSTAHRGPAYAISEPHPRQSHTRKRGLSGQVLGTLFWFFALISRPSRMAHLSPQLGVILPGSSIA
eukprot:626277-Rhodomonas_salina.1